MRQHVVMLDVANDPVRYAAVREKLKAMGWRFELREVHDPESGALTSSKEMLAEPHYWVVDGDAWVIWQWEPGEPPHPAWVRAVAEPTIWRPSGPVTLIRNPI